MASVSHKSDNKASNPYGADFYTRIAAALLSNDPKSLDELKEMAEMVNSLPQIKNTLSRYKNQS